MSIMAKNVEELIKAKQPYMIDLDEANLVQIEHDQNGKTWINVDGVCLVRIGSAVRIERKRI